MTVCLTRGHAAKMLAKKTRSYDFAAQAQPRQGASDSAKAETQYRARYRCVDSRSPASAEDKPRGNHCASHDGGFHRDREAALRPHFLSICAWLW